MKQGTLINRIVMLLLLAAVLVYLGVSAWRSFRDPYTLVLSYAYTVDDSLEATGFLVREERVLASPGGIVDLLPEEGEKVSRGETVALLYQNDSGLARKEELQSLTMEKEQLQYALERTQSGGDSSQLSQQVIDAIVALRSSVSTGDLTQLEDETLLLKSLVYKRDFTFNGGEEDGDAAAAIQSSIDAVDAQIAALSARPPRTPAASPPVRRGSFPGRPTAMRACSPPLCWRPSPPASSASSTASGPSRTPARWASWSPMPPGTLSAPWARRRPGGSSRAAPSPSASPGTGRARWT